MRLPYDRLAGLALVGVLGVCGGCNTYADSLARGQHAFEQSEHERALAIFRALEPDSHRLSAADGAHYAYLRGMTDYRIGYRSEARHWLSLAAAVERETPGSLPSDWAKRMKESLKDLDESVFSGGIASLTNNPAASRKADHKDSSDDSSSTEPDTDTPATKPAKAPKSTDE